MWPAADYEGQEVPKTVVIQAPSAAPRAPSMPRSTVPVPQQNLPLPHPSFPQPQQQSAPPSSPSSLTRTTSLGVPEWAIWAAIGVGALALLVGTVTLVILIAS